MRLSPVLRGFLADGKVCGDYLAEMLDETHELARTVPRQVDDTGEWSPESDTEFLVDDIVHEIAFSGSPSPVIERRLGDLRAMTEECLA